ncbi:hypothetical protein JTB14_026895 [Gonioctena quinquepunctata]|nr:hypothetical protein JTB14_026895 [Gonioctena quinquepunctata]
MQSSSRASKILEMAKLMKEDNINESKNVTNKNLTEDAKPDVQVISGTDPEVIRILNTAASNPEHSNVMRKLHTKDYCISPTHSNESDIDDSDEDPDFQDCSSNSSDSSSDSSNSSSDSSSSRSDEESDHVIVRSTGVRDQTQVQATMEEEESTKDNSNIIAECNQDKKNEQNSQNIGENEESRQNSRGIQVALENQELPKKGKERQNYPEFWVTKKAKLLRNSGETYKSTSKSKKQILERKLRPPCGKRCRLGCSKKIDATSRKDIFDSYWALGDLQRQREFIISHSQQIKPKYRYSSTQELRKLNSAFYLHVKGTRLRVSLSKKTDNGFLEPDGHQPTVDPEIKESIKTFINSIPRIESYYLRAQTTREFIESSKCLADLYRYYKEERERANKCVASVSMFNRIFRNEFKIPFFVPKKDQCDLYETCKNSEKKKILLRPTYDQHQSEKEMARIKKKNDKDDINKPHVIVYYLQAVMPVPKGHASSSYYKSKLN